MADRPEPGERPGPGKSGKPARKSGARAGRQAPWKAGGQGWTRRTIRPRPSTGRPPGPDDPGRPDARYAGRLGLTRARTWRPHSAAATTDPRAVGHPPIAGRPTVAAGHRAARAPAGRHGMPIAVDRAVVPAGPVLRRGPDPIDRTRGPAATGRTRRRTDPSRTRHDPAPAATVRSHRAPAARRPIAGRGAHPAARRRIAARGVHRAAGGHHMTADRGDRPSGNGPAGPPGSHDRPSGPRDPWPRPSRPGPAEAWPRRTESMPAPELLGPDEELVAGRRPVEEVFAAGRVAHRLLVVPQRRNALEQLVLHATRLRIPIVEVEGGSLTAIAGFDGHQGVALVVEPRRFASIADVLARAEDRGEAPFVLVLDSLEDPQNVGHAAAQCRGGRRPRRGLPDPAAGAALRGRGEGIRWGDRAPPPVPGRRPALAPSPTSTLTACGSRDRRRTRR